MPSLCSYYQGLIRYRKPSLSGYFQGLLRYRVVCEASGDTLLLRVISATKSPLSRLRSNFARKQPKSLTRTLTQRLNHAGLAASPVLSVPIVKLQEEEDGRDEVDHFTGEQRNLQSMRTPTQLQALAVSAKPPIRLPAAIPGNCKAHRCWAMATRWRRKSFGAKQTDSGRLHIIIMLGLKSGSANIWNTRGMKKPGSPRCCSGTFLCPTLLATIWPKTRSSTFGMFRGVSRGLKLRKRQDHLPLGCSEAWAEDWSWGREEETACERSCPRLASATVWICIKLIGLAMEHTAIAGVQHLPS